MSCGFKGTERTGTAENSVETVVKVVCVVVGVLLRILCLVFPMGESVNHEFREDGRTALLICIATLQLVTLVWLVFLGRGGKASPDGTSEGVDLQGEETDTSLPILQTGNRGTKIAT